MRAIEFTAKTLPSSMVAQIAHCDPSQGARALEQAEGDIKTAALLALGLDKAQAEAILKECDGNLRRVFAELSKDQAQQLKAAVARRHAAGHSITSWRNVLDQID